MKQIKSFFRIHEIYEFREDFLYENPMNIYYLPNDMKKRAIIDYINSDIHEIELLPRKKCRLKWVEKMKYVVLQRCRKKLNVLEYSGRRISYSVYKNTDSDYMKYRCLRNLEIQRKIDTFPIHAYFKDTIETSSCMTISTGFRKILKRKAANR